MFILNHIIWPYNNSNLPNKQQMECGKTITSRRLIMNNKEKDESENQKTGRKPLEGEVNPIQAGREDKNRKPLDGRQTSQEDNESDQ